MANRQNGGKNYAAKQNQFGLKEAYTVLQRDFLELKKAYIGNEQQVVEMQEQCLILQQSYQELQRNSQDQQVKLVEKLEKSYDAYNEKFMRVEELEEELNRCKKKLQDISERNEEDEMKAASMQHHQIDQLNFQRQILEEAVHKCLANVGLSLVTVNDHFEIKILDYKMLRQLTGYGDDCTSSSFVKDEKIVELEQANAFLQQTLLSLKDFSENQRNELSRKTDLLQKKTEQCVIVKNGIGREGDKETILVERKTFERIVNGLSEMSDFVTELQKTISDQNSWVEILMGALDEYKKSSPSKDDTSKPAFGNINKAKRSNNSSSAGQYSVNKSKMKTKSAGKKGKPSDNCSRAAVGKADGKQSIANKSKMSTNNFEKKGKPSDRSSGVAVGNTAGYSADNAVGLVQPSVKGGDDLELLEGFKDFVVVSAKEGSSFEKGRVSDSNKHGSSSSFSSLQLDTRVPVNMEPKSLRHELYQQSRAEEARRARERFETNSEECFPGDIANDTCTSNVQQHVPAKQDMCPMCNLIFETNYDLEIRRDHINSHFKD